MPNEGVCWSRGGQRWPWAGQVPGPGGARSPTATGSAVAAPAALLAASPPAAGALWSRNLRGPTDVASPEIPGLQGFDVCRRNAAALRRQRGTRWGGGGGSRLGLPNWVGTGQPASTHLFGAASGWENAQPPSRQQFRCPGFAPPQRLSFWWKRQPAGAANGAVLPDARAVSAPCTCRAWSRAVSGTASRSCSLGSPAPDPPRPSCLSPKDFRGRDCPLLSPVSA